jgi:predicted component of type VI protein secretion system
VSKHDELAIDTYAAPARRDYEHAFAERLEELEKFCQRYGVHLMPMSTDDDPVSALQTALGRRTH